MCQMLGVGTGEDDVVLIIDENLLGEMKVSVS